jgi:hypothetical protein
MKIKYFLLTRKQRDSIREIARKAFIECDGDQDKAIALAHERSKELITGSIILTILLGVAMQLIIDFIVWWIKNRVFEPALFYETGEPGYDEE